MKTIILLSLMLLGIQAVRATHLVGGYIQAKSVAGSALTYDITVVTYMIAGPATSEATSISVCFGDGATATATRVNQQLISLNTKGLYSSINVSQYRINHSFPGPGVYTLTASLINRTASANITNSAIQQEPLTLTTTFSTVSTGNQTPALSFPATGFEIALNQKVTLSLKATDADGDSLVYELSKASTSTASDPCTYRKVTNYQFPNDLTHQGTFKLNSRTGDLVWDAPTQQGYFSVVNTVSEYRNGILISQTTQEFALVVLDLPGTASPLPAYEPAIEGIGGVVTATERYADADITFVTFPNPVEDRLQVVLQTSNPTTAVIQLTDINGRKLHELGFNKLSRQHEQIIGMDSLTPGVYLLRANVNGRSLVRKVVKK